MLNMVALLCLFVKYAQICNILTQREVMRNKKEQCSSEGIKLEDTGYGYTLSVIGGKYNVLRQRLWNGRKKRGQRERKMFYNARCVNKGL